MRYTTFATTKFMGYSFISFKVMVSLGVVLSFILSPSVVDVHKFPFNVCLKCLFFV